MLQEPLVHDGVAFQFQHPSFLVVRESGNGGFHFTELRRPERAGDADDPSLKFVVVPPQVQAYDPATLVEALVVDHAQRQAAKGWTREDGGAITRNLAGAPAGGKRVRWRQGETIQAEFDVYAFLSAEGNAIGVVLKVDGADQEAQRAELEPVLDGLAVRPFTLETTILLDGARFDAQIPAVSQIQSQSAGEESIHQIRTAEGFLTILTVPPNWSESTFACSERLLQHQRSQVETLAGQSGAVIDGERFWLRPWQTSFLRGKTWRVRTQDGSHHEFRTVHFVSASHVIAVTAQLDPARREAMLTRYGLVLDSFTPEAAPLAGSKAEHFLPGATWWRPGELDLNTRAVDGGREWQLHFRLLEPLGSARTWLLRACTPDADPGEEAVAAEWRAAHAASGAATLQVRRTEMAGLVWYGAASAPEWLLAADLGLLDALLAQIAPLEAGRAQRTANDLGVAWDAAAWTVDQAMDSGSCTWRLERGGLRVTLAPSTGLAAGAGDDALAARARTLLNVHRTAAGDGNSRHVIHSTRLVGDTPMIMRSAIFAGPSGEQVRACYVFPRLDGYHELEAQWPLAEDAAARAALAELLDGLDCSASTTRAPELVLAAGVRFLLPPGFTVDQEHRNDATHLEFEPVSSSGCSLVVKISDAAVPEPADPAAALASGLDYARRDYFAGYGEVSETDAGARIGGVDFAGVRLHGRAGPSNMEKVEALWTGVLDGRFVTADLTGLDDALFDAEPALLQILHSVQVERWVHHSGAAAAPGDHPLLGPVVEREIGPARFLTPASGRITESGISSLSWTADDDMTWVRVRWWDAKEGDIDLHETLRDFREKVLPTDGRSEPTSVWRTLAGRATEGQAWTSENGDADLEFHLYAVRLRGTDLVVDAMLPVAGGEEIRAALRLVLDSLRLDGQAEGEGCLVQIGDVSLRARGAPRIHPLDPVAEGLSASAQLAYDSQYDLMIWIGPDTDAVRAEVVTPWTESLGQLYVSAPRSQRKAGERVAEEIVIADYGIRLLQLQEAGRLVLIASVWRGKEPPEARAREDRVLASLRFD